MYCLRDARSQCILYAGKGEPSKCPRSCVLNNCPRSCVTRFHSLNFPFGFTVRFGYLGERVSCMIPYLAANCIDVSVACFGPLSEISTSGIPCRAKNVFNTESVRFRIVSDNRPQQGIRSYDCEIFLFQCVPLSVSKLEWHKCVTTLWTIPLTLQRNSRPH